MNNKLVDVLVRQFEGSSGTPAEARLNNLTANLRFLVKYGHLLPTEIMEAPTAMVRGKAVLAQQRPLQTKVYLDQQDITGSFLNPDVLFEGAFQEILFMVKSAAQQNMQYLPYVPLNIVVDKEPGTLRPCLTFITRFGLTDAVATVQVDTVQPAVTTSVHGPRGDETAVVSTSVETQQRTLQDQLSIQIVESLPVAPVPRAEPITPLQAAIADSPEELNELPFISDRIAPAPSQEQASALYDPTKVAMPVREARTAVTVTPEPVKPARKAPGGWPKGKPRPKKGDPDYKPVGPRPKVKAENTVAKAETIAPTVGDFSKIKWS